MKFLLISPIEDGLKRKRAQRDGMTRIHKSHKGMGFGRQRETKKKSRAEVEADKAARNRSEMMRALVRRENPQMSENQIRVEVKRIIAERKRAKSRN